MMYQARKKLLRPFDDSTADLGRARVSRTGEVHIEDGDQHAWAVSYSDLLMVLLSFFVLFFAFADDKSTNGVISEIAVTFGEKADAKDSFGPQGPKSSATRINENGQKLQAALSEDVLLALLAVSSGVKKESKTDAIWLRLPSDIYRSRVYDLNPTLKTYLDEIFVALKPFKDQISLTFVGHSDSRPLTLKSGILKSNFVLSSLRAAGALDYALTKGFESEHLFTQGAASNLEDSRTLSLRITTLASGSK